MKENIMSIIALISVGDPLGGVIGSNPTSFVGLPHELQKTELSGISDLHPKHFIGTAARILVLRVYDAFQVLIKHDTVVP
ncbi:MAG: hypothetical protein A3K76_04375 [Euryarchaeota archaeon RBG_13_57_23]|nr:MAG: hypothetical protein A3K76_04375 [Euryarchaeota archaeon RBG_13_57_23]